MRLFSRSQRKQQTEAGKNPVEDATASDAEAAAQGRNGAVAAEGREIKSRPGTVVGLTSDMAAVLGEISSALENADTYSPAPPKKKATEAPQALSAEQHNKRRDRSLYQSLLSGLYDAVLIIDTRGSVIGSNRRAEQFFGYDERELWNMNCTLLIGAINQRVIAKIQAHAEAGRFTVVNASCKRKDGTLFPAEIAIGRIDLLDKGDLIFSIRNLERKERAQKRTRLELEALKHAAAGIAVCNHEGLIEYVNPSFVRLLQCENESDVLQRFIGDFCTSHEAANALIHTPSSQGNWIGSLVLCTASGHERNVMATAASTRQKKGESHIVLTTTPLPKSVSQSG